MTEYNPRPDSTPPSDRPATPPARRAGMLLVALGSVSAVIAAMCGLFAIVVPLMRGNADFDKALATIHEQVPIDPVIVAIALAVMYFAYAAAAIPLGILARSGKPLWVIAAIVLVSLIGVYMAFSAMMCVGMGNPAGALLPALLTVLHTLAFKWLVQAVRSPTPSPAPIAVQLTGSAAPQQPPFIIPPPPQPMQAYYEPPIPPPRREIR